MVTRRKIAVLGAVASLGHVLGMVADLSTGYAPEIETDLDSITSLSLANIAPLLSAKPLGEVLLGHYLAIFFIPLGLFGIWQVYQALKPHRNKLALPFLLVGVFGLIYASFYHGTLGFVAGALQAQQKIASGGAPAVATVREMVSFVKALSEPLGMVLLLVDAIASLLFAAAIWFHETRFPRWFAAVNPLSLQLLLSLFIWLAPHPLEQLLWLTVFNLSLAIWYVMTTGVLLRAENQHPAAMAGMEAI